VATPVPVNVVYRELKQSPNVKVMKINISEGKYSESFFKKVESFLKIYFKSEFSVHMNTSLLWIGCYIPTIDKDSFYYYKSLSIGIDKTAYSLVSDVQLHWRSPDGKYYITF
jgi:hypothetical protein